MEQASEYHRPVLLQESIDMLNIRPGGTYVDVTFGGGGHSQLILERLSESGRLIAFDRDADAHHNKIADPRLELVRSDFKFIEKILDDLEIDQVDGILADLGISSHQIDEPERGFSFRFDAPLDMRMNQDAELSAQEVLNDYSEAELRNLLRDYADIRNAGAIAAAIVRFRRDRPLQRTADLKAAVADAVSAKNLTKILTLVYQAIRIEVNGELDALESLLVAGNKLIRPGGRFVIIAYHSLEDRRVKNFFRTGNLANEDQRDLYGKSLSPWKIIARKAIKPSETEIIENSRARSARLRVAEHV